MASSPYIGRSLESSVEDGEVTSVKLATGAVTSAKLGASAVTNAKINNGAVSEDKLAVAVQTKLNSGSGIVTGINPTTSYFVNNSTVLVQATSLVCSIPEAGIYAIDIMLNTGHDTVVPTAGLRLNARYTGSYWANNGRTKGFWTLHHTTDTGGTSSQTTIQGQTNLPSTINMGSNSHGQFSISAGNDYYYQFVEGKFILDAADVGDVEIWFAQNTAVAYNTSINRNSWIKATKIA